MRPWGRFDCCYYAPKALILWYLLSSSAASRLPGKKPPGATAKAMTKPGPGEGE